MMNNFDQSQPLESDPRRPRRRFAETVDLPEHIELVLCKKGIDWTDEEKKEVTLHFFVHREFYSKIVGSLIKRGLTSDDAETLATDFFCRFAAKKCGFNPDHPKLQSDPNSPESKKLTPLKKFEIYLWIQVQYLYRTHVTKGLPRGGIVSIEQTIGEGMQVGDTLKSDNLDPWERLDLEHEKASLVRAEDLKDAEQKKQWDIAFQCSNSLPKKQREAVRLIDFEGLSYKKAELASGQSNNNLRRNLCAGRKAMSKNLEAQGIDYLKVIDDNESAGR